MLAFILILAMSQIFIQGQNFTWNTGHFFQKKPAYHDLYAIRRTKTPKWPGEPNDLKVVLGEKKILSDSLAPSKQGQFSPKYSW